MRASGLPGPAESFYEGDGSSLILGSAADRLKCLIYRVFSCHDQRIPEPETICNRYLIPPSVDFRFIFV